MHTESGTQLQACMQYLNDTYVRLTTLPDGTEVNRSWDLKEEEAKQELDCRGLHCISSQEKEVLMNMAWAYAHLYAKTAGFE